MYPKIIEFLTYCPVEIFNTEGEKLSIFRKYKGITQKKLAKMIGSDETYVCRWESGQFRIPFEKGEVLHQILGVKFKTAPPIYTNQLPQKLETIGDHLKKKRLEMGLSVPKVMEYFSLSAISSYRQWESKRDIRISEKYHSEIVEFLGYCPILMSGTYRTS